MAHSTSFLAYTHFGILAFFRNSAFSCQDHEVCDGAVWNGCSKRCHLFLQEWHSGRVCSCYRTRVRSLAMLVTNWLPNWLTHSLPFSQLESDHSLSTFVTNSLYANSKLVAVVTVADVDSEDHVGNSLLQIWELTLGPKTKLFSDFEHKGWSRFWSWSSGKILKLKFVHCFAADASCGYEVKSWSRFWS